MTAPRFAPLPIGWPLLPRPDADGRLSYPGLDASIRQSIEILLRTRPGEQLMRPAFGGGLQQLVHQPNTLATQRRIRDLVKEALERWEERIVVDRVEVSPVPDAPTELRVEIGYRLQRNGAVEQLGITLDMTGPGE